MKATLRLTQPYFIQKVLGGRGRMGEGGGGYWGDDPWRVKVGREKGALRGVIFFLSIYRSRERDGLLISR